MSAHALRPAAVAAALALAPACVWSDGHPFGELSASLETRWTLAADRGGARQRLASDFVVEVTGATATLGALTLIDVGAAALAFDPADPPPGYTLCHNGHCHAADGRLVSYEEISAELSGGAGPQPIVALAVGARDLLPGARGALGCDGGPCDLPRAQVRRLELAVERLELAGVVADTRVPPRLTGDVAWTLTLDRGAGADAAPVTGALELPIDRGHPPRIELAATFAPTAALLDGVRFELAGDGPWAVDSDATSRAAVDAALVELPLTATVSRRDL